MNIESSDFIALGSDNIAQWSRETQYFLLTRLQVGGRLLLRKSLKPQYLLDEHLRETLRKEYEVGSIVGMDSDYIVNYYQMVDTSEECYLTMDFVEGATLAELVVEEPQYFSHESNVIRFLLQLLDGLQSIHRNQVVHLDLKPSNIMLTRVSHDVRIIDLGFCYSDAYQTSMGMTDAFAAPEQKDGDIEIDARTDIYSVGKILKWLATSNEEINRWRKKSYIKKIVSRCLYDKKEDRWQNVDEILTYLKQYVNRRRRLLSIIFTLSLIVSLAALYGVFQIPVTSQDKHVLYGNFSIIDGTCEAVGKIVDDQRDPYWQGNIYVYSEISHWGMDFKVIGVSDRAYCKDSSFSTVWLPSTITHIGADAFRECSSLTSVSIPEGVVHIGACAFWKDINLSQLQIPSTLSSISEACFHNCKISTLIIPEGVTTIGLDAFACCEDLKEVYLPQSLKRIERGVFWRCKSLESVSIPAGVETIGEYNFLGCTKLKQIENHAIDPQPVFSLLDDSIPDLRLFVPIESIEKYKSSAEWNRLIIEPISER